MLLEISVHVIQPWQEQKSVSTTAVKTELLEGCLKLPVRLVLLCSESVQMFKD